MLPFIQSAPSNVVTSSGLVTAWSFSLWEKFNKCPYSVYLSKIKKLKGPQGEAAARGDKLHKAAEDYIQHETDTLSKEIKHRREVVEKYRQFYAEDPSKVYVEQNWGFTQQWDRTDFFGDDVWLRVKLDAMYHETPESAQGKDWKSGKKMGNEAKHTMQGQLYAVAAFQRFHTLEHFTMDFEYFDQGKDNQLRRTYTRDKAELFVEKWTERGLIITTTTKFKACPNLNNCRFCDFRPGGPVPECIYGVDPDA